MVLNYISVLRTFHLTKYSSSPSGVVVSLLLSINIFVTDCVCIVLLLRFTLFVFPTYNFMLGVHIPEASRTPFLYLSICDTTTGRKGGLPLRCCVESSSIEKAPVTLAISTWVGRTIAKIMVSFYHRLFSFQIDLFPSSLMETTD